MTPTTKTPVWTATITVVVGIAIFFAVDFGRRDERHLALSRHEGHTGPLVAVNGTTFGVDQDVMTVTEPLAYTRFPFQRLPLGKKLRIRARFQLESADILEVGIKKSSFWLDYDRFPLEHRILDALVNRAERPWTMLRDAARVAYLNPAFPAPWDSVRAFEQSPPDGPIGLYGNAQLPTARDARPFRLESSPDDFRAIYAFYPAPEHREGWTENEQVIDLSSAYQTPDATLEIMFFAQQKNGNDIRYLVDDVMFSVEPGVPQGADLAAFVRRNLSRLIRRPAVTQ